MERPAPQVTVRGQRTPGQIADVIGSGGDGERPRSRRRTAALAAGLAALALAGLVTTQRGAPAPAVPEPTDLVLVETGGGLSTQWGYGGRLDVSLPLLIRNDGGPMTIASVSVEGTSLAQPAVDVTVAPGGRLPLTLRQAVACSDDGRVPPDATLRLEVVRGGVAQTRVLALPSGFALSLQGTLARLCDAVPLERALVLTSAQEQVLADSVDVRVEAANIGTTGLQLLSLAPATGLSVTLAVTPEAAEPSLVLPSVLSPGRLSFRLSVAVTSCAALSLPRAGNPVAVAVADVVYDDGLGKQAAAPVLADLAGLRTVVERTCGPST